MGTYMQVRWKGKRTVGEVAKSTECEQLTGHPCMQSTILLISHVLIHVISN